MSEPSNAVDVVEVRGNEKNTIARVTFGFFRELPNRESMVQLTNPIAQHLAFYVSADDKARFIAELRAALDRWERAP